MRKIEKTRSSLSPPLHALLFLSRWNCCNN